MPKTPNKKAVAPEVKKTKLSLQLRETLGVAYSVVQGRQLTDTVSTMSLETLMKEQVEGIDGVKGRTATRPNKKSVVDRIVNETKQVIGVIKKRPIEAFRTSIDDRVTNRNQGQANTAEVQS